MNNSEDLEKLREEFKNSKKPAPNFHDRYFISIWNKDYSFSLINYPIESRKDFIFSEPLSQFSFIDYEVNSEDELNILLGDDVDKASIISSCSDFSCTSFLVSDDHFSDDEENINIPGQPLFAPPWNFSRE